MEDYFYLDPHLKTALGEAATFEQIMSLPGVVYKEKPGRQTLRITFGNQHYFLKKHFGVGWWEIFKNWLSWKKPIVSARNEWQALQYLRRFGIDTMTLVGYGERGKNPARLRSFVITRALEGTETLEAFCKNWSLTPPSFGEKLRLIQKVAELTRKLHALGLAHRDYYLCHLRLDPKKFKLYVMDLHRAILYPKIPLRWVVKDLGSLYFSSLGIPLSQRDYYRFIRSYSQTSLRECFSMQGSFWRQVKKRALKLWNSEVG